MGSTKYIGNSNSNTEMLEKISKDFLSTYGRGSISMSEITMGIEVAKINELANNNFDPERFKQSLTKVLDVVAKNNSAEIDGLYLLHCLNSPRNR